MHLKVIVLNKPRSGKKIQHVFSYMGERRVNLCAYVPVCVHVCIYIYEHVCVSVCRCLCCMCRCVCCVCRHLWCVSVMFTYVCLWCFCVVCICMCVCGVCVSVVCLCVCCVFVWCVYMCSVLCICDMFVCLCGIYDVCMCVGHRARKEGNGREEGRYFKGSGKRIMHLDTCNRKEGELTAGESESAGIVR